MLDFPYQQEVEAYLNTAIDQAQVLAGGANNQVLRLAYSGKEVILKCYFQSEQDTRPRGQAEFSFSNTQWHRGERAIAKPLYLAPDNRWGLLEVIEGKPVSDATEDKVVQAAEFIARTRDIPEGYKLKASEACLTGKDYVSNVVRRLSRFSGIETRTKLHQDVCRFVDSELDPALEYHAQDALALGPGYEVLSPSDFGFHNAIEQSGGRLRFIDFEYAGVDDSCKLIGDFFSQPKIPVSLDYLALFLDIAFGPQQGKAMCSRLIKIMPLIRIKWCCILLNEFLQDGASRRAFSEQNEVKQHHLELQFEKAQAMFKSKDALVQELFE